MKKGLLFVLFLASFVGFGQCPGVTITTQSQVDNFAIDYPGCTNFYSININGSDILNLNGLSQIETVARNFKVKNTSLQNMIGLENLTYVGGNLDFFGNSLMENLQGLDQLETVAGNFKLDNTSFHTMLGLENLIFVEGNLYFFDNELLQDFQGLNQLESVGGLYLSNNSSIENLSGLESLSSIVTKLEINNNISLTSVSGLDNLITLEGDLKIVESDLLVNFQGLNQLEIVLGSVEIGFNHSIENLLGFDSLTTIGSNPNEDYFSVHSNNSLVSLSGVENLTRINGQLSIGGDVIQSLQGLNISEVYGSLSIGGDALETLEGLEALQFCVYDLHISGNDNLHSLVGLDNIDLALVTNINIINNPQLSFCAIVPICEAISNPNTDLNVYNNSMGCENYIQIEYECGIIDIIDPLFKTAIINHTPVIDTDGDGEIQYLEAENFNGTLEVSNKNISTFGGLEAFINITGLEVSQNSMSFLDLSTNTAIQSIDFSNNQLLNSINLKNGNNTAIQNFHGTNCPNLTYICVDDAIYAENNFLEVDPQVIFTEDCALSISEFDLSENIKFFPNPVSSILNIETSKTISFEKAKVYSTLGKLILETSETQIKNLETLSAGIYFVEVVTDKGSVTKKIVKE